MMDVKSLATQMSWHPTGSSVSMHGLNGFFYERHSEKSRNKAWFQMLSGGPQPVLYWAQGCHSYLLLGLDVLQPLCQVSGGLFNSMVLGCHLLSAF